MQIHNDIQQKLYKEVTKLMGNRFEITVACSNDEEANECIHEAVEEIRRIERLLTTYNENSQTSLVNRNAGIKPVPVDEEVFQLIERSLKISRLTQGAFDLSYGSIDKRFWNFDTSMTALPDASLAKRSVSLINYRNIILNEKDCTVFLKLKGMRIGFGGIGKGYAADKAKKLLQQKGISSGVVNAAGDLITWGKRGINQPWTIGIADPDSKHQSFSHLAISDMAVATSGNYEKFVIIDGKKYAHTIDPKTGFPVCGIKSVTILCPSAELADALATPVMVMGIGVGIDLINQMKDIACIIIDDDNKLYTSKNIQITL